MACDGEDMIQRQKEMQCSELVSPRVRMWGDSPMIAITSPTQNQNSLQCFLHGTEHHLKGIALQWISLSFKRHYNYILTGAMVQCQ